MSGTNQMVGIQQKKETKKKKTKFLYLWSVYPSGEGRKFTNM